MKVLSIEGLRLYHDLASQQFNKEDDFAAINNKFETIDSEIDNINTKYLILLYAHQ